MSENTKPKVTITPDTYSGWILYWSKSHDGEGDYRASKPGRSIYAPSLDELLRRCDKADEIAVKFKTSVHCLHDDRYSGGYKPCRITMLAGDRFVYVNSKGETREGFLSWLRLDERNSQNGQWLMDNAENDAIFKRLAALNKKKIELAKQIERESAKLQPLTVAELLVKANDGDAKRRRDRS